MKPPIFCFSTLILFTDLCCSGDLDLASDGPAGDKYGNYIFTSFSYDQTGSNGVEIYVNSNDVYLFYDLTYDIWIVS